MANFTSLPSQGSITVTGELTPTGLKNDIRITNMTVTDTPTPLPLVALTKRNSISIQNKSNTEIVYIGRSDVNITDWELYPGDYFNLDITDSIILYGVCASGKSADLKIMEIS